jgi:uncharacterized membrane protein
MKSVENTSIRDKRFEAWFNNHYLQLILGILLIFTCLPIIAPVLMKFGIVFPASVIYWIYGFFCHQLPFRSWFLFGEQPYYPLARAGLISVRSFESSFPLESQGFGIINSIVGNQNIGYKIAICQRDIAIYIFLLAFGFIFTIQKRRIKRIPLWIWLLIGVIPLGLDGLSQYIGNFSLPILGIVSRESTPLLRTITGSLFGFLTGWYIFPSLESIIKKNKYRETN